MKFIRLVLAVAIVLSTVSSREVSAQIPNPGVVLPCPSSAMSLPLTPVPVCAQSFGTGSQAQADSNAIKALRAVIPGALGFGCLPCVDLEPCSMRLALDVGEVIVTPLPPLTPSIYQAEACLPPGSLITVQCMGC